jgi:hypothetical protein
MPIAPNRSPSAYRVMIEEPDGQTVEHGVYRSLAKAHVVARRVPVELAISRIACSSSTRAV